MCSAAELAFGDANLGEVEIVKLLAPEAHAERRSARLTSCSLASSSAAFFSRSAADDSGLLPVASRGGCTTEADARDSNSRWHAGCGCMRRWSGAPEV